MSETIELSLTAESAHAAPPPEPPAAGARLFPDTISLPDGFQPEGIAMGHGGTVFAGSIATGAIYEADLITGKGVILVPPQPGREAIGLSFDPRSNLLYVAGGLTGQAYAYDARTGETVVAVQLTTQVPTFVNDQAVADDAVYFTDSGRAVLYKLPLGRRGCPTAKPKVTEIPLCGDWVQLEGINANGIIALPGDHGLIVVNTTAGALFRVDPETGFAKKIDLGGDAVFAGDGMLLRGDDLFVVQNQLNQIAMIDLDRRFERGRVKQILKDAQLDMPTTIADFLGTMYVVNARFSTPPAPDTRYTIEKIRRHP